MGFHRLGSDGHFHIHCTDEENEALGRLSNLLRRVIWQSQDLNPGLSTVLPLILFSLQMVLDTGVLVNVIV